jgi:hypothetical protein
MNLELKQAKTFGFGESHRGLNKKKYCKVMPLALSKNSKLNRKRKRNTIN